MPQHVTDKQTLRRHQQFNISIYCVMTSDWSA